MKKTNILIVCSGNYGISSFVYEQAESLKQIEEFNVDFYLIKGKGFIGYLKNLKGLNKKLKENSFSVIHAHYGLSGLLANLQRKVPVITTFHGSDTHFKKNRFFSFLCSRLSIYNILTNKKQISQLRLGGNKHRYSIIKCGINTAIFKPGDQSALRKEYGYGTNERLILFASSFDRPVKNPELAKQAVKQLSRVKLIELKGFNRQEVSDMMNISDLLLMTSRYESSPMVIKEALACNTPVVSTKVGDVEDMIRDLDGCFIVNNDPTLIAECIHKILKNKKKTYLYRAIAMNYDLKKIAILLAGIYKRVLLKKAKQ